MVEVTVMGPIYRRCPLPNCDSNTLQHTGVSYLFISHDLDVVRHVSHRVAVLYKGEIVEQGEALQVTGDPVHPYTRRLLLASPVPDPDRQAERRKARLAHKAATAGEAA